MSEQPIDSLLMTHESDTWKYKATLRDGANLTGEVVASSFAEAVRLALLGLGVASSESLPTLVMRDLRSWLDDNNVSQNRFAKHIDMLPQHLSTLIRTAPDTTNAHTLDRVREGMRTYFQED